MGWTGPEFGGSSHFWMKMKKSDPLQLSYDKSKCLNSGSSSEWVCDKKPYVFFLREPCLSV